MQTLEKASGREIRCFAENILEGKLVEYVVLRAFELEGATVR